MNIWIDLANSPQVLVLRPLLREIEQRGHRVVLTTREYAQTIALANEYALPHTPIGAHTKRRWHDMVSQTWQRANGLIQWARAQPRFDIAVGHNSLAQSLAAKRLGLPLVTLMDYEHQPTNHLIFRLAQRVIVPECFPNAQLNAFGARAKTRKYPGIKEQIYLDAFTPTPNYFQALGIDVRKPIVVMRPPAPWAAYHRKFGDALFDTLLHRIAAQDVTILFMPRIPAQGTHALAFGLKNLHVPARVLDGPNAMFHADAVISGGGTMNREAAVLGTPAYTAFKGKLGAVDKWLMTRQRLTHITRADECPHVTRAQGPRAEILAAPFLVKCVTDLILEPI